LLGLEDIYQAAALALMEAVGIKGHVTIAVGAEHRFMTARQATVTAMVVAMAVSIHGL
jgi:hypothetical protein